MCYAYPFDAAPPARPRCTLAAAFLFCDFTPDLALIVLADLSTTFSKHRLLFSTAPLFTVHHWLCQSCSTCRKQQRGTCAGCIHCLGGTRYAGWVLRMAQASSETAPAPAVMPYGMCFQGKCASQGTSGVGTCLLHCCSWWGRGRKGPRQGLLAQDKLTLAVTVA